MQAKDFKCLENSKSLEKLAYWYESKYKELSEKVRENALFYECVSNPENLKEEIGVCVSVFLKKLINPDENDKKALIVCRFKSLNKIENTVFELVNDNKNYFQEKDEKIKSKCFEKQFEKYGSTNLRRYLKEQIFSFYLERYNFKKAFWFALKFDKKLLFYFAMPRLIGALLASIIILITSSELWEFSKKLVLLNHWLFTIIDMIFVLLYVIFLDMKDLLPKINFWQRVVRGIWFLIIGFFESLLMVLILIFLKNKTQFLSTFKINTLSDILFLSSIVLLIAVIMNIFWQKETIPKPL